MFGPYLMLPARRVIDLSEDLLNGASLAEDGKTCGSIVVSAAEALPLLPRQ